MMPMHHCRIYLYLFFICVVSRADAQNITGKVTAIKDGDTIEITDRGKTIKIRFFGIDCPEKTQDFGTKAKEYTEGQCFGKTVTIIPHGIDKYKRLLGEVILPDQSNLNLLLVKAGYAWRYKYSNDPEIFKLEAEARKNKRGLWIADHPKAPWEFRKIKGKKRQGKFVK
jgi:micrococcal nuclease